ncbi:hypothetical protein XvhCFBP2543_18090 [Xanthomonas vasicola]|uniref:Integrase n=3 Tax=Xanthomonas vasicola TaxID=56459 RepID=A0ABD7S7D2_XANVA|nr:hypothetical protein [Xanthomonas vasicola]AZR21534.1 hypothetical protein NX81_003250 [Xanthomonas vasicola]PPV01253.1 hypothetical protein XvhCFBP2543_18090 [Xanthomonas vasicola]TWQ26861.1 hypothetical protein FQJ97_03220 [Xanthomonas vasicola]TWQ36617.1 hypothetical protein FQJ96_15665 [Xanthomonas vasicola]TWQ51155.1 hypothetical protein FQK01_16070 [Xanthomonas vasicola]
MGLDGGIHTANSPASGEDTAPGGFRAALLKAMHTDQRDWSLPAHRRGTLGGMDAAKELTGTYLQRVLRWWTGKGPATEPQISSSEIYRLQLQLT